MPVPHREGDGHELAGHERGARRGPQGPLEDHRPLSLVVAGDAGEVARVVRRDVRAALAGELERLAPREIEEPEVHRVLRVAVDEVGLARASWSCRRKLDR